MSDNIGLVRDLRSITRDEYDMTRAEGTHSISPFGFLHKDVQGSKRDKRSKSDRTTHRALFDFGNWLCELGEYITDAEFQDMKFWALLDKDDPRRKQFSTEAQPRDVQSVPVTDYDGGTGSTFDTPPK